MDQSHDLRMENSDEDSLHGSHAIAPGSLAHLASTPPALPALPADFSSVESAMFIHVSPAASVSSSAARMRATTSSSAQAQAQAQAPMATGMLRAVSAYTQDPTPPASPTPLELTLEPNLLTFTDASTFRRAFALYAPETYLYPSTQNFAMVERVVARAQHELLSPDRGSLEYMRFFARYQRVLDWLERARALLERNVRLGVPSRVPRTIDRPLKRGAVTMRPVQLSPSSAASEERVVYLCDDGAAYVRVKQIRESLFGEVVHCFRGRADGDGVVRGVDARGGAVAVKVYDKDLVARKTDRHGRRTAEDPFAELAKLRHLSSPPHANVMQLLDLLETDDFFIAVMPACQMDLLDYGEPLVAREGLTPHARGPEALAISAF